MTFEFYVLAEGMFPLATPQKPIKASDGMFIALAQSQPCEVEGRGSPFRSFLGCLFTEVQSFFSACSLFLGRTPP